MIRKEGHSKSIGMLIATLLLVFAMLASNKLASEASAATYEVFNCNSYVTLRKTPSTSAKALAHVSYGKKVTGLGSSRNGFVYVKYGSKKGWILRRYLNNEYSSSDHYFTAKVVRCSSWISLRKKNSASSARIAKIPKGQKVYVKKRCMYNGKLVPVNYRGKSGYVLPYYLTGYYEGWYSNE